MTAVRGALNPVLLLAAVCWLPGCGLGTVNFLTSESGFSKTPDIAYGSNTRHRLDVYAPAKIAANAPVVVFFYGGTWSSGDRREYLYVAASLAARGIITVIPDYRLYPDIKFPAFLEDGAAAVAWVQQHIADYGGNPRNILVMGHSAGAHIAAMLALDERYLQGAAAKPVQGMIGLAGPYDFLPLRRDDLKDMFGPPERYPESQPINFVDGDEAPLLLLHGGRDWTVYPRNTENLAARVEAQGGCVKSVHYRQLDHFSIVAALSPLFLKPDILRQIENFIKDPGCKKPR
jgi:acetyl esterase/lipase